MSFLQNLRARLQSENPKSSTRQDAKKSEFNPEIPATASDTRMTLSPEDHHHLLHGTPCPVSLLDYIVSPSHLPQAIYFENAISPLHEVALLEAIDDVSHKHVWVELRARRLQQWAAPLPSFLDRLANDLVSLGIFTKDYKPNHILINAYEPDEGIAAHTDGPSYYPTVATLSLGSDCVMRYSVLHGREKEHEKGGQLIGEVILERGSLVVTSGVLYTEYAHSIPEKEEVVSVSKMNLWKRKNEPSEDDVKNNDSESILVNRLDRRVSITMRHKFLNTSSTR